MYIYIYTHDTPPRNQPKKTQKNPACDWEVCGSGLKALNLAVQAIVAGFSTSSDGGLTGWIRRSIFVTQKPWLVRLGARKMRDQRIPSYNGMILLYIIIRYYEPI